MDKPHIELKIINPLLGTRIPLPNYATEGAAGLDLRACLSDAVTLGAGETRLIGSGVAINIQNPALMAVIAPRSGLGIKHGIILSNSLGICDSDYQGEIQVGLWNRSDTAFTIAPGDRICQLLFVPVVQVEWTQVTEFSQVTQRGTGGLGHTGV